jgi:hypothetical protein
MAPGHSFWTTKTSSPAAMRARYSSTWAIAARLYSGAVPRCPYSPTQGIVSAVQQPELRMIRRGVS